MTFSELTLSKIQPGQKVLDLGAGNGWFSNMAAEKHALVTAVDLHQPTDENPEINWHISEVRDFIDRLPTAEMFDVIYSRNLIQFLDHDWIKDKLFPKLIQHLQPKGIVAIQTFHRDPEPSFERKVTSLFNLAELKEMMNGLRVVHEHEFNEISPDMKGISRRFFVTNIIAQKE